MFWDNMVLPLLLEYGSLPEFKNTSWSLLATSSMVRQASRSNNPLTRTIEVFIAASTLETVPPWNEAYSPYTLTRDGMYAIANRCPRG